MTTNQHPAADLFERYTKAFNQRYSKDIVACYRMPCSIADGNGVNVYDSRETLEQLFSQTCESFQQQDYGSTSYVINQYELLTDAIMTVNITWTIETPTSPFSFNALYVCHCIADEWLIFNTQVFSPKHT